MGRPYGTAPRPRRNARPKQPKPKSRSLKVTLANEDGTSLTPHQMREGFHELIRRLMDDPDCHRAKSVNVYIPLTNKAGKPHLPAPSGEWIIHPYKCAADEFGV